MESKLKPKKYSLKNFPNYEINSKEIFFIHKNTKKNIKIHFNNINQIFNNKLIWIKTTENIKINFIFQIQISLFEILDLELNIEELEIIKTQKQLENEEYHKNKEKIMKIEILQFLYHKLDFINDNNSINKLLSILCNDFWFIYKKYKKKTFIQYKNIFYIQMDLILDNFIVEDYKEDKDKKKEKNNSDIDKKNILHNKRIPKKLKKYGNFKSEFETKQIIMSQEINDHIKYLKKQKQTLDINNQIIFYQKKLNNININNYENKKEIKSDDKIIILENDLKKLNKKLKYHIDDNEQIKNIKLSIHSKLKSLKKEKDKLQKKLLQNKNISSIKITLLKLQKYNKKFQKLNMNEIESDSEDNYFSDNSELDENSDDNF